MKRIIAGSLAFGCLLGQIPAAKAEEPNLDKLAVQAEIADKPTVIAFGVDSLWMMTFPPPLGDPILKRINPADNSVVEIPLDGAGKHIGFLTVAEGAVFVPSISAHAIFKIDPASNRVVSSIAADGLQPAYVGVGAGSVWFLTGSKSFPRILTRLNAVTGAEEAKIKLPDASWGVLFASGSVWVWGPRGDLYRIDPKTNALTATPLGRVDDLAATEDALWATDRGRIRRIDTETGEVVATIETGHPLRYYVTAGGGFVWMRSKTLTMDEMVVRIDPKTNNVAGTFGGAGFGNFLAYGAGSLWLPNDLALRRVEAPH